MKDFIQKSANKRFKFSSIFPWVILQLLCGSLDAEKARELLAVSLCWETIWEFRVRRGGGDLKGGLLLGSTVRVKWKQVNLLKDSNSRQSGAQSQIGLRLNASTLGLTRDNSLYLKIKSFRVSWFFFVFFLLIFQHIIVLSFWKSDKKGQNKMGNNNVK